MRQGGDEALGLQAELADLGPCSHVRGTVVPALLTATTWALLTNRDLPLAQGQLRKVQCEN